MLTGIKQIVLHSALTIAILHTRLCHAVPVYTAFNTQKKETQQLIKVLWQTVAKLLPWEGSEGLFGQGTANKKGRCAVAKKMRKRVENAKESFLN